ncbi:MAG TPA: lipopolysaccharide transport periplasmic protein LptA [Luteibacter sp.]|nr:lipopolysaccharide transport periplasmic protein LptA [Luteibacter sp.]
MTLTFRFLVTVFVCSAALTGVAVARSNDRTQEVQVSGSSTSVINGPNTKSVVTGNVRIAQGTILVTGDLAELYSGADSHVTRVVVTGRKAHVEQQDDKGEWMKADADRIDYDLTAGLAVLTGSAQVIKGTSGTATAPKIIYHVDEATFQAEGDEHENVHMTLFPKRH